MIYIVLFFIAYLLGAIPFGLLLGKGIWGIDLRQHGSKNIGATNAWRTLGKVPGVLIFFCDFLKGFLSVYLAYDWIGTPWAMIFAGLFAIIGHSASIFLNFQGGKGVATGLGVVAMLMPLPTVIVFLIWLLIVKMAGYVSLASILAAAFVPLCAWFAGYSQEYLSFGVFAATFIILRHKSNIIRLLNGTESKIKAAKK